MPFYPAKINQRFIAPQNGGALESPEAAQTSASFVCGAVLQLNFKIENNQIVSAKFKTAGCGFLIAAADYLCAEIIGKTVAEVCKTNVFILLENEFEKMSPARVHCFELIAETLTTAINNFQIKQTVGRNVNEALICRCFGVSERTIAMLINEKCLATVEEVTGACSAGGGCGSCQLLIQEILDNFWRGEM